jgi:hypothetical protein
MPNKAAQPPTAGDDPDAIFHENGPIEPTFIDEAIRDLMRATPLRTQDEPRAWTYRRMYTAMRALAALHPRDEIEVMLGVQAVSAYRAAAACWHQGINLREPCGASPRHIATAARTFDTLLKALERRQAKPLTVPAGRPAAQEWTTPDVIGLIERFEARCAGLDRDDDTAATDPVEWTPDALAMADAFLESDRREQENEGLDIANTEGILPGGGMIMPEVPTPQQAAYVARRLGLAYKREYAENRRQGIRKYPQIRPIRTGDLIP